MLSAVLYLEVNSGYVLLRLWGCGYGEEKAYGKIMSLTYRRNAFIVKAKFFLSRRIYLASDKCLMLF